MSLRSFAARWWAGDAGAIGAGLDVALLPAEWLFRAGVAARNRAFDAGVLRVETAGVPVVSVGNIGVGGAGKTPFAAWLAARLRSWGHSPGIALRGYGEDEVLLHRELNPDVPVFAAWRRVDAARAAGAAGCDTVVLDDAFQHRALARDLDIVLVSVEDWDGAPKLLPRGPWRESPAALRRADLVVLTRKSASPERAAEVAKEVMGVVPGLPVLHCHLRPNRLVPLHPGESRGLETLAGCRVLAVAALASPRPLLEQLRSAGAEVAADIYPDHHDFSAEEARVIRERAGGSTIVMTRKDAVKLRPLLDRVVGAWVLEQSVEIESGLDVLDHALRRALGEGRGG
ncbi:MAG TPA: tetraacyldisaccharide 4'-kinase [Longimicrobiaceae bacterium]|nr:tetraacyldisaccharide 4'-kinase [Longimicrobiaceae bacterium]